MPLQPGTSLGPYQIQAALGAGGMGEVYKARDTRLDRTVAIKVLPEHVAADPDLKQRFEREAKTVAGLSHPHICPVFDVGEQDGINYLVMEYLDGETLAQRLEKGALPLDQALQVAIEIADALDKAHRQGIVHRDLKPGNIMLTKSGAKLLDFGLAKPTGMAMGTDTAMATMSGGLTGEGAILGTLQYMAPEQLEGDQVDARTDIFAFGTTVYEMVTGTKVFEGKSQAGLIHAIMGVDPPPLRAIQPVSPRALDRVLRKCVVKDPERRWQSAQDLHDELVWIAEGDGDAETLTPPPAESGSAPWRQRVPVAVGISAAAIVIAGLAVWALRPTSSPALPVRFVVSALPSPTPARQSRTTELAIAPDGSAVAYRAVVDGVDGLYVRRFDRLEAELLTDIGATGNYFMSPDGKWIGFSTGADRTLKKMQLSGGPALTLCPIPTAPRGASWGPDDTIIFARDGQSGLFRVSAAGGEPEMLTAPEAPERHYWPEYLPTGDAVLFTILQSADGETGETSQLAVLDLDSGEQRVLLDGGTHPRYLSSGQIVYSVGSTLRMVPFDAKRLEVVGDPIPVLEGVASPLDGGANVDVSDNGTLVYQRGTSVPGRTLVWVDRTGQQEPLPAEPRFYQALRISPDGERAAITVLEENEDVLVYDLVRNTPTRFTFSPGRDNFPVWSPDGERIVFASNRDGGQMNLFWKAANGTGEVERLTTDAIGQYSSSWSSDGSTLVFVDGGFNQGFDVATLSMDGDGTTARTLDSEFTEWYAELSPDGRWLAYGSDESGQGEIYVRPFPNIEDGKWQISRGGGNFPLWSPDGRELFYRWSSQMRVVSISTEPTFAAGNPSALFDAQGLIAVGGGRAFDIHPDGQRFLMISEGEPEDESTPPPDLVAVENWTDELQRLVPTP